MSRGRKIVICSGIAGVVTGLILAAVARRARRPMVLQGAVVRADADPRKQRPVSGAQVTAESNGRQYPGLPSLGLKTIATTTTDAAGAFRLSLQGVKPGDAVTFSVRHDEYLPLEWPDTASAKLFIARLSPLEVAEPEFKGSMTTVANMSIRYTQKTTTSVNIGSGVKVFSVANQGGMPCNSVFPCSPDGRWKASLGSESMDAGEGNEFKNARASCIAGPCPFTHIETDNFSRGGRKISVAVRNWSDTTTFLFEAEVYHAMVGEVIRNSYPVVFGSALNFSLPAEAEGASIQAEINGESIIFPLGPNLCLSWADCTVRSGSTRSRVYRCELKPGFKF